MATVVTADEGPFTYVGVAAYGGFIELASEISAAQYLSFARADYASGLEQGLVNALGNAKRSFHLMIDTVLHNYGLLACNKRLSFAAKLQLLDSCDLISLRILRKLNVERNIMEHEYRLPPSEVVSDAIDVCQLLHLAIDRLCEIVPLDATVGMRDSGIHAVFHLDQTAGRITVTELLSPNLMKSRDGQSDYVMPLVSAGELRASQGTLAREPLIDLPLKSRTVNEWLPYLRAVRECGAFLSSRWHGR
ncbi:hypothetical protein DFJ67_8121 [Asanoa ferruginea]|uniref:Uncharacterized protein n=1 Tax=Asanoa ferruginea TaxID=53367 RepID=A0A3D9ZYG3_9ACTN|nr:hypothetical protein [Asanoa ferruginea]REG02030.1 hypothetical protein DFJ67_8121 [Asanoa ferruginea]GIF52359.1 hypothetical protein Afe04nite_68980 [Asanoa ferruginea]